MASYRLAIGCMAQSVFDLEDFLLSDSDALEWLDDGELVERKAKSSKTAGQKAEADHMLYAAACKIPWPPDWSKFEAAHEAVNKWQLTARQAELVYFIESRAADVSAAHPSGGELLWDINMSVSFMVEGRRGDGPCAAESSVFWLQNARRRLVGPEALAIQGFPLEWQPAAKRFGSRFRSALAGNAFCGFTIAAVFTSILMGYDFSRQEGEEEEAPDGAAAGEIDRQQDPEIIDTPSDEIIDTPSETEGSEATSDDSHPFEIK